MGPEGALKESGMRSWKLAAHWRPYLVSDGEWEPSCQ